MACAPHYCDYHNTGTTTCSGHRGGCPSNRTLSFSEMYQNNTITAAGVEELRYKIRDEISSWNAHSWYNMGLYEPGAIGTGQFITNETFNNLDNMVGQMYGSYLSDLYDGNIIDDSHWDSLIGRYNVVRQNCICNSDCACNAVCVCHGNCGCVY